jgi:hypothetical protein
MRVRVSTTRAMPSPVFEPPSEGERLMADFDVVPIAVAPPAHPDEKLVSDVAAVIGKSLSHTRLLLAGELPRIIAHADSLPAAEAKVRKLHELGLTALALSEAELRRLPKIFEAQTLEFSQKAVTFRDSAGGEKGLATDDVFLILTGRVESSTETKTTRSRLKFSWGGTLVTGGIPVFRRVKETTTEKSSQTEEFARLYSRKSAEPGIGLRQHQLNYSFLGAERAASATINFSTLVRRLRQAFPEAIFDDRLTKPLAITSGQDVELSCCLIYLFQTM